MVPTQMNANSLLNANYLYTESSFPLPFPEIPIEIDHERTRKLAYPATVVLNSFTPRRERLAIPAMPVEIGKDHTSELAYPATVVLNSFSPGREVSYA